MHMINSVINSVMNNSNEMNTMNSKNTKGEKNTKNSNKQEGNNERDLIIRAKNNDQRAYNQLINKNDGFIHQFARTYVNFGDYDYKDCIQHCEIGLYKAIIDYDLSQSTPLIVYAKPKMKDECNKFCATRKIVSLYSSANKLFNMLKKEESLYLNEHGYEPTHDELYTTFTEKHPNIPLTLKRMKDLLDSDIRICSLDSFDDNGNEVYQNELEGEMAVAYSQNYLDDNVRDYGANEPWLDEYEDSNRSIDLIYECIEKMPERRRDALNAKYSLDNVKHKMQEVADKYGVSAEIIRQERIRAEQDIKAYIEANMAA